MTRSHRIDALIALLVLLLTSGCPQRRPQQPPARTDRPAPAPPLTAPAETETKEPEQPSPAEPPASEPAIPEPAEPNRAEPNDTPPPAEQTVTEPQEEPNQPAAPVTETETPAAMPEARPEEPNTLPANEFHNQCIPLLKTYVNEHGDVDYPALSRRKLDLLDLLAEFRTLSPEDYTAWSPPDQTAFWINAYNLCFLKVIIDNYPIESPRLIRVLPGWGPNSIRHIKDKWTAFKFIIMDEEYTLREMEDRHFRTDTVDPRVFFALSIASESSPPLRNEPYRGDVLDTQLDDQVRRFLATGHALQIDRAANEVRLSSILTDTWFGNYFVPEYGIDRKFKDHPAAVRAVLNMLSGYLPQNDVTYLETANYSIDYLKYDWTLNEQ